MNSDADVKKIPMHHLISSVARHSLSVASSAARPIQIRQLAMICQMPPPPRPPDRVPERNTPTPALNRTPLECESLVRHASLVGYLTLDKQGRIVRVNECGAVLLGESRGALLGQLFRQYVVTKDHGAFGKFTTDVFKSDSTCECHVTLLRIQPSTTFRAQLSAVSVRRKENASRCLLTLIDISDLPPQANPAK